MNEDFLQYVWSQRLYGSERQETTSGDVVEILNPGILNSNAGPDFFNAQVKIGNVTWAGNVEIHISSDDWVRHHHNDDPAYNNVILHVVGRSTGSPVFNSRGQLIPEIELRFPSSLLSNLEALLCQKSNLPVRCSAMLGSVSPIVRTSWLDSLLFERLEAKSRRFELLVDEAGGDRDQAFFVLLARAMGGRVNSEPMELLARFTPLRIIQKHPNALQAEALLLGQSGLLDASDSTDLYVKDLKREYALLRNKFNLEPVDNSLWKYLRMRPANFPDLRLAQLASILRSLHGSFESLFHGRSLSDIDKLFQCEVSDYWQSHYRVGVMADNAKGGSLGAATRRIILINAVIPYMLADAIRKGVYDQREAVVEMLRQLPVERNSRLELWQSLGLRLADEGDAQALLHLYSAYCEKNKCLRCRFGHAIVSRNVNS